MVINKPITNVLIETPSKKDCAGPCAPVVPKGNFVWFKHFRDDDGRLVQFGAAPIH